jgi:DnaB-like helicase N terminal domain
MTMTFGDPSMTPEEAYVAALLASPHLTQTTPALDPRDFTEPEAQAIYQAILEVSHYVEPQALYERTDFIEYVAAAVQDAGVDRDQLTRLADMADTGAHASSALGSTARIIIEAAIVRDLTSHGQRLAADPDSRELGELLLEATATARTVAEAARQLPAQQTPDQAQHEIAVLASLLTYPAEAIEVTRWLPPQAFTPGIRQDIYQAITDITRAGDPLDTGSVMHLLAEARDPGSRHMDKFESISWYFQHNIDPVAPPPGAAMKTGYDLLAAHALSQLNLAVENTQSPAEASPETKYLAPLPGQAPDQNTRPLLEPPPTQQPDAGPQVQP